jgi:hypothetical protein
VMAIGPVSGAARSRPGATADRWLSTAT